MRKQRDVRHRGLLPAGSSAGILVCALAMGFVAPAAAIDTITTDTTINDASFTTGVEVVAGPGPVTTTVWIETGAQIGTDTIPDPQGGGGTYPNVSVAALDDSVVNFTGGTVDGSILMWDTSHAEVSGVTLNDKLDTFLWATATISDVAQILGDVIAFDDSAIGIGNSSFSGSDLTAFDQSQIEYNGGTMTVDSAVRSYATSTIDMDGVNINGNAALWAYDLSEITCANATITGDDAVAAYTSGVVNLENVDIVGDEAIRVYGGGASGGRVTFVGGSIEGVDPIQAFTPSSLELRDVTITDTGGGSVDAALRTYGGSDSILKNVHIDGGGITMFGGTMSLDDVTFESSTELLELYISSEGTEMTILGQSFLVDGVPTDPCTLSTVGPDPLMGSLSVTLRNGETMAADFWIGAGTTSTASIVLMEVPEPTTAVLLASAAFVGLMVIGRRRRVAGCC